MKKRKSQTIRKTITKMVHNFHVLSLENPIYKNNHSTDMSDVGNEVGYVVGHVFKNMTEEEINDFIVGFKHGVSLTNGTH